MKLTTAEVRQVPIASIVIGKRRRAKLTGLQGLMRSIERSGLIHPIIVRNGMELVAGGRRLEACRKLGWTKIAVRRLESMSDDELRTIELDENIHREPLTDYEATKTRLAEIKQVEATLKAKAEAEAKANKSAGPPTKRKRGNQKKAVNQEMVAKESGTPVRTRSTMEKQVDYAERFPFLQRPGWNREQTLKAGKIAESFTADEQTGIATLLDQKYIPPDDAIKILENLNDMPEEKRSGIFEQAKSADEHERAKALTAAAELPPPPDPGCLRLAEAHRELERAANVCRDEMFKERIVRVAAVVGEVLEEFRKQNEIDREAKR